MPKIRRYTEGVFFRVTTDDVRYLRQVSRRITVPGTPREIPIDMVQAALLRDPMSITYQHGGILLEHTGVVG